MLAIIILAACLPLYVLPAIVGRNRRDSDALAVANLIFGWTGIGWGICLVWALMPERR